VYTLVQAGKLKVLAVQADKRSPYFPDVPTVKEQGVDHVSAFWWTGISFPKGTPEAIVNKWQDALDRIVKDENFLAQLKNIQLEPSYLSGEAFRSFIEEEAAYYTELGKKTGIRK
jgi:tripartite-type tricarboxylate transporter receptor subunit TctC